MKDLSFQVSEEVEQAFVYLKDDLIENIKDDCSFDIFHKLSFSRYINEEFDRLDSIDYNLPGEVLNEATEKYERLLEEFQNLKQEYSENMDEMPSDEEIFSIALSFV